MIKSNSLSYRDHDARIIYVDGIYLRLIFQSYQVAYDHLMNSGLYHELLNKNLIIEHKERDNLDIDSSIYKTLYPKQIGFLSYPYEWTPSQWRNAILAFIEINQIALKYGMILKDATPYNFYFEDGEAILFDTSSFMFYKDGDPWMAYRQFCEGFFGPIVLSNYNSPFWHKLYVAQKAEMSLKFISKQLPIKSWLCFSVLINIHLHARFLNAKSADEQNFDQVKAREKLSSQKIIFILNNIRSTIKKWDKLIQPTSNWSTYYDTDIQSESYLLSKKQIIEDWLETIKPESILDVGANTGFFTNLSSKYTKRVVALESDLESVDLLFRSSNYSKDKGKIYTVNADVTDPSPGIGFMNEETMPLIDRISSDLVMGLALVHHLCFSKRLALDQLAYLFSKLTLKYALVEFIAEEDIKVRILQKSNPGYKYDYSEQFFINEFSTFFTLVKSEVIENSSRKLFLFHKK